MGEQGSVTFSSTAARWYGPILSSPTWVSNLIQRTKGKIRQSFQSSVFGIRACLSPWRQQLPPASQSSCRHRAECFYTVHDILYKHRANPGQSFTSFHLSFGVVMKRIISKRIRAIKNPIFYYSDWFMASFGSSFIYQVCSFIACLIAQVLQEFIICRTLCSCSRIYGTWHRNCSGSNITVDLFLQSVNQFWHSVSTDFCEDSRKKCRLEITPWIADSFCWKTSVLQSTTTWKNSCTSVSAIACP